MKQEGKKTPLEALFKWQKKHKQKLNGIGGNM